jgi:uncharacterized membrane protein
MILSLIILLSSTYLAEALYFAYQQLKENKPAPTHAVIHTMAVNNEIKGVILSCRRGGVM